MESATRKQEEQEEVVEWTASNKRVVRKIESPGVSFEEYNRIEEEEGRYRCNRRNYRSGEKAEEIGNGVSMESSVRVGKMMPMDVWTDWSYRRYQQW